MTVYYQDDQVTLHAGDCIEVLALLPESSVDAVVTDPPYGIRFMGNAWDGEDIETRTQRGRETSPMPTGVGGPQGGYRSRAAEAGRYDLSANAAFGEWVQVWASECLRLLKPGGYLLAFGGSRTSHRLAAAIEDAGFEIRDSIAWLTGSGFPKSLNVGNDERFCQCPMGELSDGTEAGLDAAEQVRRADMPDLLSELLPIPNEAPRRPSANLLAPMSRRSGPGSTDCDCSQGQSGLDSGQRGVLHGGDEWRQEPSMERRGDPQAAEGELRRGSVCAVSGGPVVHGTQGRLRDGAQTGHGAVDRSPTVTHGSGESYRPHSSEQRPSQLGAVPDERGPQAWGGWPVCGRCRKPVVRGVGTALKPAHEPIVVARKPICGTVAANVQAYGTGALNIDGCRVASEPRQINNYKSVGAQGAMSHRHGGGDGHAGESWDTRTETAGRWPTNVVLDGDMADDLDEQSGGSTSPATYLRAVKSGNKTAHSPGIGEDAGTESLNYGDSGGPSRFFPTFRYTAKAPGTERPTANGVAHPTVKPLELMRWLVRLVTPPGGTVLDCFAGTGTTGEAAIHEHMRAILIEREPTYLPLIVARLSKPMAVGFDFGSPA